MNLTMKFIIFTALMLTSSITFSQLSIDQELKGRVAGLTVFPRAEHLEHPVILEYEEMDRY